LNPGFISVVAMTETAQVLERAYGQYASEIAAAIERTLQADILVAEDEQQVFAAMVALRDGRRWFADALIGALGQRVGYSNTATFDRKVLRRPGFASR
jgi:predicted nucleic-acid-binding protein